MTDPAVVWCRRNHLTSSAQIISVLLVAYALIRSLDLYSGVISGILRDNSAKLTPNSPRSPDQGPGSCTRPRQTVGVIHGVTTSPPPHQSSEFGPDTDSPCQPSTVLKSKEVSFLSISSHETVREQLTT